MDRKSIRAEGGGRKIAFETVEGLDEAFINVIAQHTAGSPMDETQKWINLERQEIADLLAAQGKSVSVTVVDQLLKKYNYRKRKVQYDAEDLVENIRKKSEQALLEKKITLQESQHLLQNYESSLGRYTYLSPKDSKD